LSFLSMTEVRITQNSISFLHIRSKSYEITFIKSNPPH
jgi:hypothetical protein